MYSWIRPIFMSVQLMIENCESYIHQNAIAESAVGTMNGSSTMARSDRLERNVLVEQQRQPEPEDELDHACNNRVERPC